MRLIRLAALATLVAAAACSHPAQQQGIANTTSAPRDPNVITELEIRDAVAQNVGTVYDLVVRLHPQWLRSTSSQMVQAWQEHQRLGSVTQLRSVPLTAVSQIRYLSPSEAQGQLGMDNQGGAIMVFPVR